MNCNRAARSTRSSRQSAACVGGTRFSSGRWWRKPRAPPTQRSADRGPAHDIEALVRSGLKCRYDVDAQEIWIDGDSTKKVHPANGSSDDKLGVVGVVEPFYSQTARIPQPKPEVLDRLREPTRKKVREIIGRMICRRRAVDPGAIAAKGHAGSRQRAAAPARSRPDQGHDERVDPRPEARSVASSKG